MFVPPPSWLASVPTPVRVSIAVPEASVLVRPPPTTRPPTMLPSAIPPPPFSVWLVLKFKPRLIVCWLPELLVMLPASVMALPFSTNAPAPVPNVRDE